MKRSLVIHEMYGCQCMIQDICIHDNLFNCRQPHQHIHLKQKKQVLIIKKWKETFTYLKFNDKFFKLF